MKIACISLGCPKNQVDLDVMVHIQIDLILGAAKGNTRNFHMG